MKEEEGGDGPFCDHPGLCTCLPDDDRGHGHDPVLGHDPGLGRDPGPCPYFDLGHVACLCTDASLRNGMSCFLSFCHRTRNHLNSRNSENNYI